MIILRDKSFGRFGKIGAGLRGAAGGAAKGAQIGAVLAPFNVTALAFGKKKLAAGITAAGALTGAAIGSKIGWDEGVSKYRYDTDPEFRKKVDEEEREFFIKSLNTFKAEDLGYSKDFNYSGWLNLSKELDIPSDFLKYVKFYDTVWKKKIEFWYSNLDDKVKSHLDIPEFKALFPIPINPKLTKQWYDPTANDLILATDNCAGDDGWLMYSVNNKEYGWDCSYGYKTLKDLLLDHLDKRDYGILSKRQNQLVNEFRNKIKAL